MEGFKTLAKGVKCFKEGGSVYKSRHSEKSEEKSDIKQDKAIVKKGVKQHEAALHKGQPKTELKLKQGGRAKKSVGTVKKFEKASGEYGAKKTAADKKNIQQAKQFKPKKMQYGGMTGPASAGLPAAAPSGAMGQISDLEKQRNLEKMKRAKQYLGPAQQSELIKQDPRAAGLMRKKGGKVKKCAAGGSIDDDVRARAMKWIEAGSPENTETAETPVVKKTVKKEVKLYKPDYSNEDLDRMGMNKDIKQPESDREEYSPWMREYRKNEAKSKQPESDREEYSPWMREYRKNEAKAKASTKGPRAMKSGKKVC
jgi:hypothetical protein